MPFILLEWVAFDPRGPHSAFLGEAWFPLTLKLQISSSICLLLLQSGLNLSFWRWTGPWKAWPETMDYQAQNACYSP